MENDPVLQRLDEHIALLKAELQTSLKFRAWWRDRPFGEGFQPAAGAPPHAGGEGSDTDEGPTLRERIKKILAGGDRLKPPAIRDAALADGWETTSQNQGTIVRNTLRTMVSDGEVRESDGYYFLANTPLDPFVMSNGSMTFDERATEEMA